jgi:hypothetical protein
LGKVHFVELVKRTPPDESAWKEKWPTEEEALRRSLMASRQLERIQDYFLYLRDRSAPEILVDPEVQARVLGLETEETPAPQTSSEPSKPAPTPISPSAQEQSPTSPPAS